MFSSFTHWVVVVVCTQQSIPKRKMRGPDIDLDDIPDN